MTVGQLIEALRLFPLDLPVYRGDSEWCSLPVKYVRTEIGPIEWDTGNLLPEGVCVL